MSSNDVDSRQEYEEDHQKDDEKETRTLGLVPAPELPEEIVTKVADELPDLLSDFVDDQIYWKVESVTDPLTGAAGDSKEILEKTEKSMSKEEWDYAICVTDLPIFEERLLVVADVSVERNLAVISLPSLGANPMKQRVREAIVQITNEMYHGSSDEARQEQQGKTKKASSEDDEVKKKGSRQLTSRRLTERLSPITRKTLSEETEDIDVRYLINSKFSGGIRLISGMVFANRPWTIFPTFKSVLAVAFASGAYALIFPSLWLLSDAYEIGRFVALMITSIAAMVTWIIVAHNLWEKPVQNGSRFIVRRYNIATVITLLTGVLFYYTILFVLFLGTVTLLVPSSLMEEEIVAAVNAGNYVLLAWLAASVATIVGALGAGLESEETVLKTTYGYRQRRRKSDAKKQEEKDEDLPNEE
ncbi:hypothetical protein CR194_03870 [Salipaludibacillus keqinensis]|uniref:5,10-methylene-tetrahydrofolate dehydrogenase n=1 Tax=Salipaludibacillus keqinensis TaxID=2045207 RepID=A0A323TIN1_9BACI|nr:hypothetical protein [Salipaludibacillus keqinensis]PYZ94678.1 hypothetical protein CR194_03870 [Salipaludibacillus keqinensis]